MTPATEALRLQIGAAIARAGWSETARRSGLERSTLHRVFGNRHSKMARHGMTLDTLDAVVTALGLRLSLTRGVPS